MKQLLLRVYGSTLTPGGHTENINLRVCVQKNKF